MVPGIGGQRDGSVQAGAILGPDGRKRAAGVLLDAEAKGVVAGGGPVAEQRVKLTSFNESAVNHFHEVIPSNWFVNMAKVVELFPIILAKLLENLVALEMFFYLKLGKVLFVL